MIELISKIYVNQHDDQCRKLKNILLNWLRPFVNGIAINEENIDIQPISFVHSSGDQSLSSTLPPNYDTSNNGSIYVGTLAGSVYVDDGATYDAKYELYNYSDVDNALMVTQVIGGATNASYNGPLNMPFSIENAVFNKIVFTGATYDAGRKSGLSFVGFKISISRVALT